MWQFLAVFSIYLLVSAPVSGTTGPIALDQVDENPFKPITRANTMLPFPIQAVPIELFYEIFRHIPSSARAYQALCQTCVLFYRILRNENFLRHWYPEALLRQTPAGQKASQNMTHYLKGLSKRDQDVFCLKLLEQQNIPFLKIDTVFGKGYGALHRHCSLLNEQMQKISSAALTLNLAHLDCFDASNSLMCLPPQPPSTVFYVSFSLLLKARTVFHGESLKQIGQMGTFHLRGLHARSLTGYSFLAALQIAKLSLSKLEFTEADMSHLAHIKGLKVLELEGLPIVLARVNVWPPSLTSLSITAMLYTRPHNLPQELTHVFINQCAIQKLDDLVDLIQAGKEVSLCNTLSERQYNELQSSCPNTILDPSARLPTFKTW